MKIKDVIRELEKRMEIYGNAEVVFRDCNDDSDIDVLSVYYDEDTERAVVSNQVDFLGD